MQLEDEEGNVSNSSMIQRGSLLSLEESTQPKILVVNDNFTILRVITEFLADFFVVFSADSGVEALSIVLERPQYYFDVIMLDINMPIMDGFELCEKISNYIEGSTLSAMMKISVPRQPPRSESGE
jgi:CheY-like chemotaxis protein